MTDFLTALERDLVEAAARRQRRGKPAKPAIRTILLAAALFVLVGAGGAAGTLTVLRGSPLPAPTEQEAGPTQTPVPGTTELQPMRAADPGGGPPWALRTSRSRTGLVCTTVGQVVDGQFGIVGLDGRFREVPEAAVDGCGRGRPNKVSLAGARVLDARRSADVRTVVNGYAGPSLRAVQLTAGGTTRSLPVGPGGTFVHALRGYPEDIGVQVRLRFADGHVERYPFGTDRQVVLDPLGGHAWVTLGAQFDRARPICVLFQPAREYRHMPVSPPACGIVHDLRRPRGYWFAVRRLERGGRWRGPPRTAVWGSLGKDVKRVVILGRGERRVPSRLPGDRFLAVYPPTVDPASLSVEVTTRDGRVHMERGDTNLVNPPVRYP